MLFEGFKDDIKQQLKDAKVQYKAKVKDLKKSYLSELNDCLSDIDDNYTLYTKSKEKQDGLSYYMYEFYCDIGRMDELFEDLLSSLNKVFNHLNSDVDIGVFYAWMDYNSKNRYGVNNFDQIERIETDNMEVMENFFKKCRRQIKTELVKTENLYDKQIRLWDVVSDKPRKSPSYQSMSLIDPRWEQEDEDQPVPFTIFIEMSVG